MVRYVDSFTFFILLYMITEADPASEIHVSLNLTNTTQRGIMTDITNILKIIVVGDAGSNLGLFSHQYQRGFHSLLVTTTYQSDTLLVS
jgi:hypothetical protein